MLATKHVTPYTSICGQVAARSRHAAWAQPTLLLTWHTSTIGALCCCLQECLSITCMIVAAITYVLDCRPDQVCHMILGA